MLRPAAAPWPRSVPRSAARPSGRGSAPPPWAGAGAPGQRFGRQYQRGRAVGHQRAVGAFQWAGDKRVPVGRLAAELEAEVALQMGVRNRHAVAMVLRGDGRQRIRPIAEALAIPRRDRPRTRRQIRAVSPSCLTCGRFGNVRPISTLGSVFILSAGASPAMVWRWPGVGPALAIAGSTSPRMSCSRSRR